MADCDQARFAAFQSLRAADVLANIRKVLTPSQIRTLAMDDSPLNAVDRLTPTRPYLRIGGPARIGRGFTSDSRPMLAIP